MESSAVGRGGRARVRPALGALAASAALIAAAAPAVAQAQTNLYVAPGGSDATGTGSRAKPWATVDKARAEIRSRGLNQQMQDDVVVNVAPGTYYTTRTIVFDEQDSGSNGHQVVYRSSGPLGSARLVGGRPVTGWSRFSGDVYRAQVGDRRFSTLYENGVRSRVARYPNYRFDARYPMAQAPYLRAEGIRDDSYNLQWRAGDVDLARLGDLTGAKLFYWPGGKWSWYTDLNPIASINPAERTFTLANKARYPIYRGNIGARYFIQDALSLLDAPGEFYLDRTGGWLYYKARDGAIADQTIIAPDVKRLVSFAGSSQSAPVHDVTLEGLTLEMTDFAPVYRHAHVDNGDSGEGHAHPEYDRQMTLPEHRQGMVFMENTDRVTIRDSRLRNAGYSAVYLLRANRHALLSGNWIERAGHTGVLFDGAYPGEGDVSRDNTVTNSVIRKTGELVGSGSGVQFTNSGHNTLSYMTISDAVRYGASVIGYTDMPTRDMYTAGNQLHHISIRDSGQDSGDMGLLNTFGLGADQPFNVNVFRQITIEGGHAEPSMVDWPPNGVFLDHQSQGQTLEDVEVTDVAGDQYRSNDPVPYHTMTNVSWEPGFDSSRMDYANIGARADFPYPQALGTTDSFEQRALGGWQRSGRGGGLVVTGGPAHSGRRSLLQAGRGGVATKALPQARRPVVTVWLRDDARDRSLDAMAQVGGAALGVDTTVSQDRYVVRTAAGAVATGVPRTSGWHELRWDYRGVLFVDGRKAGSVPLPTAFDQVSLGALSSDGRRGVVRWDDLRVEG